MPRRRLLLVADSLEGTAAERHVHAVVDRLSRRRFDIRLASVFDPPDAAMDFRSAKVPYYSLEISRPGELRRGIKRLRSLVKSYRIDVVHTFLPHAGVAGHLAAAGRAGLVTTVFDVPADDDVSLTWDLRLRRRLARGRYARPPLFLTESDYVRRRCEEELGMDRVEVVRGFHEVTELRSEVEAVDRDRARRGHAVRSEEVAILHVGDVTRDGGQDVLLEAFKVALVEMEELKLFVAGTGPRLSYLRVQAEELSLGDRVVFLGGSEDLPPLYAMADLFVLPSRREPFPDSLVEAMAAGLATVASDVDAVPEVVSEAEAVLVEPERPDALARGLLDLARDPSRRRELGDAARGRAADFSVSRGVDRLEEVYTRLGHAT